MIDVQGPLRRLLAAFRGSGSTGWILASFWLFFGLAVLSALPVFMLTRSLTDEVQHGRFVAAADQAASRLAHEIDLSLANLRALKGLYLGSVHVSRNEFSAFVRALSPSETVQSLDWIPRVFASARSEYELAARQEGFSDFRFRQYGPEGTILDAADRPEYFPVYYLEPHGEQDAAFGLDLASSDIALDVLRRAGDSGEQAASGRVRLSQRGEDQYGFVVLEPIYSEAAMDLDSRIERLEGFARGVFRVADLVRLAIPENLFQSTVLDLSAAAGEQQLYPSIPRDDGNAFQHAVSLDIADRRWLIQLAPASRSALSTLPWIAAATWLGALMVLWIVRELFSSRRHSRELAVVNRQLASISDERQQAIKELERSNRELDDFAYIVSHDLKEPLRALHNHAGFLVEDYQDQLAEDGQRRLLRLVALSRRMERLIGDLLHLSRLGRGEAVMETVDLHDVIADIEASLAEALQQRHAEIVIEGPLPLVQGRPPHMLAVFQNLICNGVKYNDSEVKRIEIGCLSVDGGKRAEEAESTPKSFATFYVRDNGIGIDEAFSDEVFRIFRRLNNDKAYGEGTGAGLSFVKKIIENQGGTIWLTSRIGKGTTFMFTLKRAGRQLMTDDQQQAA